MKKIKGWLGIVLQGCMLSCFPLMYFHFVDGDSLREVMATKSVTISGTFILLLGVSLIVYPIRLLMSTSTRPVAIMRGLIFLGIIFLGCSGIGWNELFPWTDLMISLRVGLFRAGLSLIALAGFFHLAEAVMELFNRGVNWENVPSMSSVCKDMSNRIMSHIL